MQRLADPGDNIKRRTRSLTAQIIKTGTAGENKNKMTRYWIGFRDKAGNVQVRELKKIRNLIDIAKAEAKYGTGLITATTAAHARHLALKEMELA